MRRYLFDTGSFSNLVNRRRPTFDRAVEVIKDGHRLGICPPVLGEFYAGLELSDDPSRSRRLLRSTIRTVSIWPYDHAAAKEFGRVFAILRRIGRPMQQIDVQIAAIALTLGRTIVVSQDTDFRAIPGLDVEDWAIVS